MQDIVATRQRILWSVLAVCLVWLATTYVFWVGYVGTDDLGYSRYAYLFHRPPMNWLEFRMPAVLAIRASFLAFGASEFAATLPVLLASLAILGSVAWFAGWPSKQGWQSNAAVLFVVTLGYDVSFRSTPGATYLAAGFLALGTVCILLGGYWVRLVGSALLALGFSTHETSVFYIGIFCLIALWFDWRKYLHPVLLCMALSALSVGVEGAVYHRLLGDAMARFKTSGGTVANLPFAYDPDTGISGIQFFLWPLKTLLFSKVFGVDLVLLFVTGTVCWKRLNEQQRILFLTTVLTWAWLGYGSQVPWSYRPLYRQMHYYAPLVLGIGALLPVTLGHVFRNTRWAYGIAAGLITFNLALSAAGGQWGQDVAVSRQLLSYAKAHPAETFVTDVTTMNHMYAVGGFELPQNVVCLNGPAVENVLRVNKEPAGTPRFHFPERTVDGMLINLQSTGTFEPEFSQFVQEHEKGREEHTRIVPVRYKLLFQPLLFFTTPKAFMTRSLGGELIPLNKVLAFGAKHAILRTE